MASGPRGAGRKDAPDDSRRVNRAIGVGDAVGRALDPALRRRGFASRDIIANWKAMAPRPYDLVALPDRLAWPRGQRGTEGAILYLRCQPGHGLALAHEGQMIAAAINRYFGYVLVGQVRLSATPFSRSSSVRNDPPQALDPQSRARLDQQLGGVADEGVREALKSLGEQVMRKERARKP